MFRLIYNIIPPSALLGIGLFCLALVPLSNLEAENYKGKNISISANSMQLADFFLLIAEVSNLNVVLDPDVHGTISLNLKEVPWDQVLALVARDKLLVPIREGNVLYIIPSHKVAGYF